MASGMRTMAADVALGPVGKEVRRRPARRGPQHDERQRHGRRQGKGQGQKEGDQGHQAELAQHAHQEGAPAPQGHDNVGAVDRRPHAQHDDKDHCGQHGLLCGAQH
jgi:hypothetical protein